MRDSIVENPPPVEKYYNQTLRLIGSHYTAGALTAAASGAFMMGNPIAFTGTVFWAWVAWIWTIDYKIDEP